MRHVIVDSHGEVILGGLPLELVEDRLHHRRSEFLRRQTVSPADNSRPSAIDSARLPRLAERGHDVEVERLAGAAGLLGAIEHRYRARGLRQGRGKSGAVEGTEQAHLEHTDLLSACEQALDRLVGRAGARAHQNDHPLRLRISDIFKKVIAAAGPPREAIHNVLNDRRAGAIERIDRFARLEEDIRILRRATQHRTVGAERALAMLADELRIDERAQIVV